MPKTLSEQQLNRIYEAMRVAASNGEHLRKACHYAFFNIINDDVSGFEFSYLDKIYRQGIEYIQKMPTLPVPGKSNGAGHSVH